MKPKRYPLILDDGKRHLSRRPGQSADCAVRAFAILAKLPYDQVYDVLAKAGRKPCDGFYLDDWLEKRRNRVFNGRLKRIRGIFTPCQFIARHKRGRYLLDTGDHVFAVIDGKARDLWRVKEKPLCNVWRFVRD